MRWGLFLLATLSQIEDTSKFVRLLEQVIHEGIQHIHIVASWSPTLIDDLTLNFSEQSMFHILLIELVANGISSYLLPKGVPVGLVVLVWKKSRSNE